MQTRKLIICLLLLCYCTPQVKFGTFRDFKKPPSENVTIISEIINIVENCSYENNISIENSDEYIVSQFFIMKDGTVKDALIKRSSSFPRYDSLLLKCISSYCKFPSLPSSFKEDSIIINLTYYLKKPNNNSHIDSLLLIEAENSIGKKHYAKAELLYTKFIKENPKSKYTCFALSQ